MGVSRDFPNFGGTLLSQERVDTDFKFGGYIYRANPNKSPLKILEKIERGRIQGMSIFLGAPIISGTGKAADLKFCKNIHRVDRNKSPINMLGIVAVGIVRESWTFQGTHV